MRIPWACMEDTLNLLPYPALVSKFDGTWSHVLVNSEFTKELGYTLHDMPTIEDWFKQAYPEENYRHEVRTEWERQVKNLATTGNSKIVMRVRVQTRHNGQQWYEVTNRYTPELILVIFINIQEVKAQEERLAIENANRDKMLSVLSHDLRSPIKNLVQLTKLFRNDQLTSDELRNVMLGMHADVVHALDLLETLLTWTRSNFSRISITYADIDLRQLIFSIVDLFRPALEAKNLQVEINVSAVPVRSDEAILNVVMRNLISNALKFSMAGGKISVESLRTSNETRVGVTDQGAGMSAEVIHFITTDQPFSKAGTQREQGFGLGLRLCREFLPLINGRLDIESSAKGTKMTVVLPVG